jgi:Cupin domain
VASAVIDFKVSTLDTNGGLAVCEITYFHKGGPARHLHHEQDEWFYVVEGEYVIEVGEERYELGPRDSVLAPRLPTVSSEYLILANFRECLTGEVRRMHLPRRSVNKGKWKGRGY